MLNQGGRHQAAAITSFQEKQKMKNKMVRHIVTRELFIETESADWGERLEAWKVDHEKPCPMPTGHHMFSKMRGYENYVPQP